MKVRNNLKGQEFGKWFVIAPGGRDKNGGLFYWCECCCNEIGMVRSSHLKSGASRSCGCNQYQGRHGHTINKKMTKLYKILDNIKTRVFNPKHQSHVYYRGIGVYREWLDDAKKFLDYVEEHLGELKPGHTIDRIDNEDSYRPGNIRFTDYATQARNRRPYGSVTRGGKLVKRLSKNLV